jgi:hypothetical protein
MFQLEVVAYYHSNQNRYKYQMRNINENIMHIDTSWDTAHYVLEVIFLT